MNCKNSQARLGYSSPCVVLLFFLSRHTDPGSKKTAMQAPEKKDRCPADSQVAMRVSMKVHPHCVRYYNTLHGCQYLGADDDGTAGFVACMYSRASGDERTKKQLHSAMLIEAKFWDGEGDDAPRDRSWLGDFIGRTYAAVRDRRDIPAIINALLALGCLVQPWTKIPPSYTPSDAPFSIEKSEQLMLDKLRRFVDMCGSDLSRVAELSTAPRLVIDERLWKTEAGKAFARKILETCPQLRLRYPELNEPLVLPVDPDLYVPGLDWPPPDRSVPAAAEINNRKRVAEEKSDEINDCMVCLEHKADTMVLPCQHQVACRGCSDRLRDTPNAHKCIMCRQPITSVLADDL